MDLTRLRDETPGVAHRIHLNNAGAGLMPRSVLDAVQDHIALEARIGGYEAAYEARDRLDQVYASLAALLGAGPHRVAVVENATVAVSQALSSIPWREGDALVTTRNDYASNQIMYLSLEARFKVRVMRAPDAPEGGVDVAALEELVHRKRPRLVAMTHIPTSSGLVQPAAAVGRICREKDALYLVDACQSVGQQPVDVDELQCDFLAGTARKFLRGPRGVGFLVVSDRVLDAGLEPLFPDMRGADWIQEDLYQPVPDARRFENWEFSHGLVLGLGRAAELALEVGLEPIRERARSLASRLREGLTTVPGVEPLDRGAELGAIVAVHVPGRDPAELVLQLREKGVNSSSMTRVSAVMDLDDKGVEGLLRFSPHYYNTEEEVDGAVEALRCVLS